MSSTPDRLPSALTSLGRSLRLGYRASPGLIVVAFVTTIGAAAPDALYAVGLATLVRGLVARDGGLILFAALGLGLLATCGWLLDVVTDRANLRFADRAAVVVESHVAHLQSAVVTIEHHERPEYLDRLSLLRDHAGALSHLYQQLFMMVGAIIRLVITLVLLASVHPLLGLLGLFAVPSVLVSNWRGGVEKSAEEAGAQDDRRARHLFALGTGVTAGKELRVAGVQHWVRDGRRAAWGRRYAALARARWTSGLWQGATQALFGAAFIGA